MTIIAAWGRRSAVIGGALRIIASFVPYAPENAWLEGFYAVIDVCLLFGLIAVLGGLASQLGGIGQAGSLLAITGQASILGPDARMFGVDFYLAGTAVLLVGLGLVSVAMIMVEKMRGAAVLWLGALALAVTAAITGLPVFVMAAGVTCGAGFVLAGRALAKT